ncbi:MAG: hypothetical protein Q9188_006958, partial [Gyalolechia gomerana]
MAKTGIRRKYAKTIASPEFIDTASCHCALRPIAEEAGIDPENTQAWQCIQNPYKGLSGKWYFPISQKSRDESVNGYSLPDTATWFTAKLVDDRPLRARFLDSTQLISSDKQCTGLLGDREEPMAGDSPSPLLIQRDVPNSNDEDSVDSDQTPSCQGGSLAVAVTIQDPESWQSLGCLPGFLSRVWKGQNNTIDNLPEYCPPLVTCQNARLTGGQCPPQGIFEPFICPAGYYCPLGGQLQIRCPSGHYCSVGAYRPTPCSPGASCPEGTNRNMSFLPPGLILAFDVILLVIMIGFKIRDNLKSKHKSSSKGKHFSRLHKHASFFDKSQNLKTYPSLQDDDITLESRITHVQRLDTGFGGNFTPVDTTVDNELISDIDLFIQSMSKCIGTEKFGLSFEFSDLKFQPKKASKPILSEVTGKIDRGSLWGVMGASGAGKSTFVNVLMGKQAYTGGVTKINGVPGDIKKYKKIIGYVPQDDIVLPELTVRENILHSARIRLPSHWGESQIQKHVDTLISCLQLTHVKDSLVGSAAKPVISGGQRKRVSIGIELAAAPIALFLDEPTSGLDATSASSIMMTLKELSRLNITVITIIHQPRAEIFESLDSLILFGRGRVIYQGPEQDVQAYFEDLGFRFPHSVNPADTIMDIIAGQ